VRSYLVGLATSGDPFRQTRALPALAALAATDQAIRSLFRSLAGSPEAAVRAGVAEQLPAVAKLSSRDRRGCLLALLGDSQAQVRAAACRAVTAVARHNGYRLLQGALSDPEPEVREAAVEALGRLPGLSGWRQLEALAAAEGEAGAGLFAGLARACLGVAEHHAGRARRLLRTLAFSPLAQARWAAASALAEPGLPLAEDIVAALLSDSSCLVRCQVVESLRRRRCPEPGREHDCPRRLRRLHRSCADGDAAVRRAAAAAMASCAQADPDQTLACLDSLASSRDPQLRLGAAAALADAAEVAPEGALPLIKRLCRDRIESVRAGAALALARLPKGMKEEASVGLLTLAGDRSPLVRGAVADACARGGLTASEPSRALLLALARDSELSVRQRAARALGESSRPAREVLGALLDLAAAPATAPPAAESLARVLSLAPLEAGNCLHELAGKGATSDLFRLIASRAPEERVSALASLWAQLSETVSRDPAGAIHLALTSFPRLWRGREGRACCHHLRRLAQFLSARDWRDLAALPSAGRSLSARAPADQGAALEAARLAARGAGSSPAEAQVRLLEQALDKLGGAPAKPATAFEATLARQTGLHLRGLLDSAMRELSALPELSLDWLTRAAVKRPRFPVALRVTNRGGASARDLSLALRSLSSRQASRGACDVAGRPARRTAGGPASRAGLKELPPGASCRLEIVVAPPQASETCQLAGELTWRDARGRQKLALSPIVNLRNPGRRAGPLPNPYLPGKPLEPESALFLGREEVFDFLRRNLGGDKPGNVLALIGQRRVGKTSLLNQLAGRLGNRYRVVLVDMQGMLVEGAPLFFHELARRTLAALPREAIAAEPPAVYEFRRRPSRYRDLLAEVSPRLARSGERLVIAIDEFDDLEHKVRSGLLGEEVFAQLRHLMQHLPRVSFLLTGTHRVEELGKEYWSFLFNLPVYRRLGLLGREEAARLVMEPLGQLGIACDDLVAERVFASTGGHPYLLQLACHRLVETCSQRRAPALTAEDADQELSELARLGRVHVDYFRQITSPPEQALLNLLAAVPDGRPGLSRQDLQASCLRAAGVDTDLTLSALESLLGKELVRRDPGERFSLGLGLLRELFSEVSLEEEPKK
jgi:HEAT repeat protein